jgi:hypothetical protein
MHTRHALLRLSVLRKFPERARRRLRKRPRREPPQGDPDTSLAGPPRHRPYDQDWPPEKKADPDTIRRRPAQGR